MTRSGRIYRQLVDEAKAGGFVEVEVACRLFLKRGRRDGAVVDTRPLRNVKAGPSRILVPASERVGQRFAQLVILSVETAPKGGNARVRCDCGTEKVVRLSNILQGNTTSCGCIRRGKRNPDAKPKPQKATKSADKSPQRTTEKKMADGGTLGQLESVLSAARELSIDNVDRMVDVIKDAVDVLQRLQDESESPIPVLRDLEELHGYARAFQEFRKQI